MKAFRVAGAHRRQIPGSSVFSLVTLQSSLGPSASTQGLFNVLRLWLGIGGFLAYPACWWLSWDYSASTTRASLMDSFITMHILLLLVFLWRTLPYPRSQSLGQVSQLVQGYLAVWGKTRVWMTVVILSLEPKDVSNLFLGFSYGLL